MDDPDADILELISANKLDPALRLLMHRHGTAIYRYCRNELRDEALADDVQQIVFIQAHHNFRDFGRRARLKTWLFGIARNRVRDARKRRRRTMLSDDVLDQVADPSPSVEKRLDDAKLLRALRRCMEGLGERAREAVMLRHVHGRTFEEMANMTGTRAGTLEARTRRAVRFLRKCVEKRLGVALSRAQVTSLAPDLAGERAALARIEEALRQMGEQGEPAHGWEAAVLAGLRWRRARRCALLAAALLGLVAVVALTWKPAPPPAPAEPLALAVTIEASGHKRAYGQGGLVAEVDAVLTAVVRGGRHRVLWIYRGDDQLLLACPAGSAPPDRRPACLDSEAELGARVLLRSIGSHTIVALASDRPITAPSGRLDADVSAARSAGAEVELRSLDVR